MIGFNISKNATNTHRHSKDIKLRRQVKIF